jgi:hypothetical protein
MTRDEIAESLRVISKAWGRNQTGYCFFPWIDREEQERTGQRRAGYHEGPAFQWPKDRDKIITHMEQHEDHDLYWCPSLFEYDARREELAMDEHALWADLDEVDPRSIEDFPPTIAWESSPGRYQALWIIGQGDIQGSSWPGNENQKLTYHLGADLSGWDTTQLLRVPGWTNHKPEYNSPKGKLLWSGGRTWLPDEFDELPDVVGAQRQLTSVLEKEIEAVDRAAVLGRVKLKLNHKARELLGAKKASGDRSDNNWYLMRCLADAGCTIAEIVAIARETVWNKFEGRANELQVLIGEASKAIAKRSDEVQESLEEEANRPSLMSMAEAFKDIKPPKWLIEGCLTEGAVGFIAGQPKSYKSWCGLDMALSVSTGSDFLDYFRVLEPGPVLYIQEEDPVITLKDRAMKIWRGKRVDKLKMEGKSLVWEPSKGDTTDFDPAIAVYIKQGVTISEESWQIWLDEQLAEGFNGKPYKLVIIDTLMRTAGAVDENRAVEMMTKVFKPLSLLGAKHKISIQVVHHMRKGKNDNGERGGQLMLGSVANHAWSEDSIYLSHTATGDIAMDYESKTAPGARYKISNLANKRWEPAVSLASTITGEPITERRQRSEVNKRTKAKGRPGWSPKDQLPGLLDYSNGRTIRSIATELSITPTAVSKRLHKAVDKGLVTRGKDNLWRLTE